MGSTRNKDLGGGVTPYNNEMPAAPDSLAAMLVVLVLLYSGTALTAACFGHRPTASPGRPSKSSEILAGIDVNRAEWFEIAQLPGIGEHLARRVIEYRDGRRDRSGDRAVFVSAEDLARVKGIGAKTVRRLAPFVRIGER